MKRIIYLTTLLLVFGLCSFGQSNSAKEDLGLHDKIQVFMHAQLNNDVGELRKALDRDAIIFTPGKLGEVQTSKTEYLNFSKQIGKLNQDCYPHYEILRFTTNTAEVNIDFAYPDFLVRHLLSMAKKGGEWKIIQIRKTIEAEPSSVTVMQQ